MNYFWQNSSHETAVNTRNVTEYKNSAISNTCTCTCKSRHQNNIQDAH